MFSNLSKYYYTPRVNTRTQIHYIIVCNQSSIPLPVCPIEFSDNVLSFLREMPIDILQLLKPESFFKYCIYTAKQIPFELTIIYSQNVQDAHLDMFPPSSIKVFILQTFSTEIIRSIESAGGYYYLTSAKDTLKEFLKNNFPHLFDLYFPYSESKLIKNIITRDIQKILLHYSKTIPTSEYKSISELLSSDNILTEKLDLFEIPLFKAVHNLCLMLNQITGGYWDNLNKDTAVSFEQRWKTIIKYCQTIDQMHVFVKSNCPDNLIRIAASFPLLPSLILITPFHNPRIKRFVNEFLNEISKTNINESNALKQFLKYFAIHQNLEFIYVAKDEVCEKEFAKNKSFELEYLEYLDGISFLHSSFSYSPSVRTPIIGKSLYKELSVFSPESGSGIPTKKKIYNLIKKIGAKLSKEFSTDEFQMFLSNRNGQIVAITDLPIEWLTINGIPIGFSHDICRMPSSHPHGLMSNYVKHSKVTYKIPNNILEKTLILLASPEDSEFNNSYEMVESVVANDLPVIVRRIKSFDEAKLAVNELKPHLLIFDTHGGYDIKSNSSYLMINNNRVNGREIAESGISSPLIILSACWTSPVYSYGNTLSEAFFESGSLAVLSSYLPIAISTSTILYCRILYNLASAAKSRIHPNWLSFLSHNLRTAILTQTMFANKPNQIEIEMDNISDLNYSAEWISKCMDFTKRAELFKEWELHFNKNNIIRRRKHAGISFSPTIVEHEYLYYTIAGRADLIPFEAYLNEVA